MRLNPCTIPSPFARKYAQKIGKMRKCKVEAPLSPPSPLIIKTVSFSFSLARNTNHTSKKRGS